MNQLYFGDNLLELHQPPLSLPITFPRSPLRYPGGKTRAVKLIHSLIPANTSKLCSPFLGGGSIELACSTRMEVFGYDVFSPLVDFWQIIIADPHKLANQIQPYFPLSRHAFYELQKTYMDFPSQLERAAAFYVLNRSSFSGTTLSGGMSPGHPRFTQTAIDRVKNFKVKNFKVQCADFEDSIKSNPDAFLYLDPPYLIDQALYGHKGNTHKTFEHDRLADLLNKREQWIMSYNDCPEIRDYYKDHQIVNVKWTYGMGSSKKSNEVLIISKDIEHGIISE